MSIPRNPDQQFHENLQTLGRNMPTPESPSNELRSRCIAEFESASPSPRALLKRPALISTLGLAACLALVVGLLFPTNGGPTVQAATILARLNEQIEKPERIVIIMDSIVIEEVSIDGHLQVARAGVAGDVHVVVTEDENAPFEIDVALALSPDESWVLIRKLQIPDPDVQPILAFFFPPGSETLLILPEDIDLDDLDTDFSEELQEIASLKLVEAFQELIRSQPDVGATIIEQPDGTLLMTLPIQNAEAISQLILMAVRAADKEGEVDLEEVEAELESDVSIDGDIGLIGSTLSIVYDPATGQVRSFTFTDFGQGKGTLSVDISGGMIDPDLFDASRVTTPNTRTFDLAALQSLFEQFDSGSDDE